MKYFSKISINYLGVIAIAFCIVLSSGLANASSTREKISTQIFSQERILVRDSKVFEYLRRDFTSQNVNILPALQLTQEDVPATHVAYSSLSAEHCIMGLIKSLSNNLRTKPTDQLTFRLSWENSRELKFDVLVNANKKYSGLIQNDSLPITQSVELLGSNGIDQTYYRCMTQNFEVRGEPKNGYGGELVLLYRVP